ncbi:MAG TPA: bifunctional nuclease family protein [Acidimicrobiales bacterium]|nr:bifunctional nuclease family protein [Acidimicrobiales bacterium]
MTDGDAGADAVQPTEGEPVAPTGLPPTPLEVLELSPEEWRIVAVAAVEMDLPSANPEIVLHEAQDPWRELRIPVGLAEGTAIAYAFRAIDTPRPLTHELVTDILDGHDVSIAAVRITVRRGRVFFAEIDTTGPRGRRVLPCRPSDAIALALRQRLPTPILVAEWVFRDPDGAEPSVQST